MCSATHSLAQTAVDGAVAGHVERATVKQPAHQLAERIRLVGLTKNAQGVQEEFLERVVPVRRDGVFLVLRVPGGPYRVEELRGQEVIATTVVSVQLGEVAEVEWTHLSPSGSAGKLSATVPSTAATDQPWETLDAAQNESNSAGVIDTSVRVQDATRDDARGDDTAEQESRGEERPEAAPLLSFHGLAPTQNRTLADGMSGDQTFRGGARGGAAGGPRGTASAYGTQSAGVSAGANGFSAQYGSAAGMVLETSAGRQARVHGGATYSVTSNALAATNPFAVVTHYRDGVVTSGVVKPEDLAQTFGGRVGGVLPVPWLHQRVAAFASVEQGRRSFPAEASPATTGFYDLSPFQASLLMTRGVTAAARNAALDYLDSLTGAVAREANRGTDFVRIDGRPGERDTLTGTYSRSRLSSPAGSGAGAASAVIARGTASVGDETVRVDAVAGRWLHLFGGNASGLQATNEVRAQYARDFEFETARTPLAQEPAISPGGFAPQVSIYDGAGGGPAFVYGTPASLGRRAYPDERRVELADVAQVASGRHLFTFGGDWSHVSERIDALNDLDGSYTYDSGSTNGREGGLVDWITDYTFNVHALPNGGCPSIQPINAAVHDFCFRSYQQSFGQSAVQFALDEFAGFAQDLWRVRAGLTVELGVRYEYVLLPLPQQPNPALDAVFGASGATSSFPEDRNNAGPRAGIAWAPREGKWGTVRVGYGAYAGRLQGTTVRTALVDTALPTSATHVRITPSFGVGCPQVANQGFGFPCAYMSSPPATVAATTSATVFARGFRLPVVQVAELSLARGWRGVQVSATYSGAWATQLPKTTDLNIAPSAGLGKFMLQGGNRRVGVRDGETFAVPMYAARLSAQYGAVTELASNADATWNALTVETRGRLRGGVALRGSYTWSKALDFGAEQGATPQRDGQFDPFDERYDKGVADANVPQRFAGDLTWRSTLSRGPGWLQAAASGWRMSALGSASSGRAYSYQIFGGTHLSGGGYSLNGSGGSAYLPTVGRNTLRMPARWQVNARVARGFQLGTFAKTRLRGEGFAEATNLTNHVSPSQVNDRAFLVGTAVNGVTPLVFQDAATVAAEGLSTTPFGAVTSSTLGGEAQRRVRLGILMQF